MPESDLEEKWHNAKNEVVWGRRISQNQLRRLYQSEARGILDEELIEEVGITLFVRCQSVFDVSEAKRGRITCPRCIKRGVETTIVHDFRLEDKSALLSCSVCTWQLPWGMYQRTYQDKQLNEGGAGGPFRTYLEAYAKARSPRAKLLAIDHLIHEFHYKTVHENPRRIAGVNLIEGTLREVITFLDELSYGDTPEFQETKKGWKQKLAWQDAAWEGGILPYPEWRKRN